MKKYFILLAVGFGVLLLPQLSHASDYTQNYGTWYTVNTTTTSEFGGTPPSAYNDVVMTITDGDPNTWVHFYWDAVTGVALAGDAENVSGGTTFHDISCTMLYVLSHSAEGTRGGSVCSNTVNLVGGGVIYGGTFGDYPNPIVDVTVFDTGGALSGCGSSDTLTSCIAAAPSRGVWQVTEFYPGAAPSPPLNPTSTYFHYNTPAPSSTIANFPNWEGQFVNLTTSTISGDLFYVYGTSTELMSGTSSFSAAPGSAAPIEIPNNYDFIANSAATDTVWFERAGYVSGGITSTFQPTYFTISPSLGSCDNPAGVSLSSPFPSSTIYNDFAQWKVATPNLLEGCNYIVKLTYSPTIESITGVTDQATVSISPGSATDTVAINKSKNLWNYYNATTTQITYGINLLNQADGYTIGSQTGSFYLAYNATTSALTAPSGFDPTKKCGGVCTGFGTIGGGQIATPTSTIADIGNVCTPASDWTDIGGGLTYAFCSSFNWLFVPNDATQNILNSDLAALESVPPFSWFFLTNAQIQAIAAGDSSYITPGGTAVYNIKPVPTTTDNGVSFTIFTGISGATTSLTLLPADLTTNSFLGSNNGRLVDDYYNFVLTAAIAGCIIMMYKIIL